ncbi:MAG: M20/M25/M40 family metallo-hydrolase [Acidimicrobiaceae bacterium]|nr:M20/M25/M40 family metallo-hydrolase [Acidimicrobiaceae bacterium]MYF32627.1 M20/M25/M40 family metallo-hydrolase [Acidimicrobiaceae bacterium]
MRVAVVYNRDSRSVINLFGMPNQEKIGLKTIKRLTDALRAGGHQVTAMEADKELIAKLESFMPRVVAGERPGMVFNVSYGLQGQARYTHVPSILEMVGIPYVASGPLGHSLALDKVVTKMILRQNGIPTPEFAVLETPEMPVPDGLPYPMVVKPKNEAVSFGLAVVHDTDELRTSAKVIFDRFSQPVLAEQYVEGREINVGLLGNGPPEAFPPVMLSFGDGPQIYTYEDKTGRSGRQIQPVCPAPISEELTAEAKEIAVRTFSALGLYDCARVDMRMDADDNLYVLEANSLPSLGEHGSYLVGAAHVGLDFAAFVNRLVEVASARYFGTPQPPAVDARAADPSERAFQFVTQRRDAMERSLRRWVEVSSRTDDPVGLGRAAERAGRILTDVGMRPVPELTDDPEAHTFETVRGFDDGVLLVAHLDVPVMPGGVQQGFRRDPEWLYGEGVGRSRASLVMLEYALRALRSTRSLRRVPLGVLLYCDEGRDAAHSRRLIEQAAARAEHVLVCRPGTVGHGIVTERRGSRRYDLTIDGERLSPGQVGRRRPVVRWACEKVEAIGQLSSPRRRLSIGVVDMRTDRHAMFMPHRVEISLMMSYLNPTHADETEAAMRKVLGRGGPKWSLHRLTDRPPMTTRPGNQPLVDALEAAAAKWEIEVERESSAWPSVAGLVPEGTAAVCGVSPAMVHGGTPEEAVQRISLVQRTLVLTEYLISRIGR